VPLYDRDYTITVQTLQIRPDMQVAFTVKRTLKTQANTVDLRLYNLTAAHRAELSALPQATVQIDAGYVGQSSTIFLGDLRTHNTVREGTELVTQLSAGDGEKLMQTKRISQSFRKGSKTIDIVKALAAALGVDPGNLAQASAKLLPFGDMFSMGTVCSGSAAREMTRVLKAVGFTWSIQNGKLQILSIKDVVAGSALLLTSQSGLLDSPTIDKDGFLNCRSLMIPDVFPGRLLVLVSESLSGNFRIEETSHSGDFKGSNWDITYKARKF
jgi:hypothetical protein